MMFKITEAAIRILDDIERPEGRVVRLVLTPRGTAAVVVGKPRPDDLVVDRSGHEVLHIQPALRGRLKDAVLDTVDTPRGRVLSIRGK